jgi:hypothetical protein
MANGICFGLYIGEVSNKGRGGWYAITWIASIVLITIVGSTIVQDINEAIKNKDHE